MGALGDGGMVTTSDPELEARMRQLRYMGQKGVKHEHVELGYQERLDEMQAAFLRVKLRHLEEQLDGRRRVAARYAGWLDGTPVEPPAHDVTGRHAYYMYTVLAPRREELRAHLDARRDPDAADLPEAGPGPGRLRRQAVAGSGPAGGRPLARPAAALPADVRGADRRGGRSGGQAIRDFYGVS